MTGSSCSGDQVSSGWYLTPHGGGADTCSVHSGWLAEEMLKRNILFTAAVSGHLRGKIQETTSIKKTYYCLKPDLLRRK